MDQFPAQFQNQERWQKRLIRGLRINRAIAYALLLRGWQLGAGAVSVLLISMFFSEEVQGYYYTCFSLLALQSFFELGLQIVIVSSASHQWADLKLDVKKKIVGSVDSLSRLISLGRMIAVWYAAACVVFVVVVGICGAIFFAQKEATLVTWQGPWLSLVVLNGLLLWTLAFNALLEGCNQVASVNKFRVVQAVCANISVWTAIMLGAGLWAAVAATAARLLCDIYFLAIHYRHFFAVFLSRSKGPQLKWGTDIWPMQWRMAISALFSYFEFSIFTPVIFHYHTAEIAGRTGMTLTLIFVVQAAALAWVQTRAPQFGMLIAKREFDELDRIFMRASLISTGVLVGGAGILLGLISLLQITEMQLGERLLPLLPTALFLLALIVNQLPKCQEIYLRSHRREPFVVINMLSSVVAATLVWGLGGGVWGPTGAAIGLLLTVTLINLPWKTWVWLRCRRDWH
ncbi:MAG: hypothetical protein MK165_17505 [Pirellulaceae bacterium]|nr:hypothetical protein [Pirellulaceae bacterium]